MGSARWLLLNLNVSGYFRVNYNQENWEQLLAQLSSNHQVRGASRGHGVGCGWAPTSHTPTPHAPHSGLPCDADSALSQVIPVINRAQIIDDAFNLAR